MAELRHAASTRMAGRYCSPGSSSRASRPCRNLGLLRILERLPPWPFVVYRAFIGAVLLGGVAIGWLG